MVLVEGAQPQDQNSNVVAVLTPNITTFSEDVADAGVSLSVDSTIDRTIGIAPLADAVRVRFGETPVAIVTDTLIPVGTIVYFHLPKNWKVSVVGGAINVSYLE